MSTASMSTSPTMTNPDVLSEAELRAALSRANDDIFRQALRINDLELVGTSLAKMLVKLCEMHLAGNTTGLEAEMKRLSAHYVKSKAVLSATRSVH